MKILLLGEFSGFYTHLSHGLRQLGHDVTLACSGDGWKKIEGDILLGPSGPTVRHDLIWYFKALKLHQLARKYDVIQFINPFSVFPKIFFPLTRAFKEIRENSCRLYMSAAGCDAFFWSHGRKSLRYGPFDDTLAIDKSLGSAFFCTNYAYKINSQIADMVDGIIPVMHEYHVSYVGHPKVKKIIPLPVNLEKIKFKPLKKNEKIVIFHGINRPGFKGTRHIEKAFTEINKKYPRDVECVIANRMPYCEYLKTLSLTHVVVDQVNSYSSGMNALISLAMGKIVIGGAEKEGLLSMGMVDSPVFNAEPSPASVIENIERILEQKGDIEELSFHSRRFVEENHDYIKIASRYLDLWSGK